MAEDADVLRQVWHSYLPIAFRLAANEVTSLQEPDPYYAMVSRMTYFPLVLEKVVKHLSRFCAQNAAQNHDLWLDFEGTPLKWHYPVGVLYDLLGADSCLPWTLSVHFEGFPEDALVRCSSRAAIEAHLMSGLKEADALRNRSQVMSSLQRRDHNQLWLGLSNDRFDQFWAVNRSLAAADTDFRYIPFRVYARDLSVRQKLVKPRTESGAETTFGELCALALGAEKAAGLRLLVHGIRVPPETPVQWVSRHLAHCDNFVHICALET